MFDDVVAHDGQFARAQAGDLTGQLVALDGEDWIRRVHAHHEAGRVADRGDRIRILGAVQECRHGRQAPLMVREYGVFL
ncbi:hypothetical protein ACFC4G_46735 [Streptomyces sp. NPDC056002]|uniref:hypothetical protein n=1 Tax=Streptomyces sp. NPDC056002 TaxID=3345675 RepID=UPI0035DA2B5E